MEPLTAERAPVGHGAPAAGADDTTTASSTSHERAVTDNAPGEAAAVLRMRLLSNWFDRLTATCQVPVRSCDPGIVVARRVTVVDCPGSRSSAAVAPLRNRQR